MTASGVNRDLLVDLQQFLFHEAMLLDDGRFDEWLDLFDDDVLYFMPTREVTSNRGDGVRRLGELPFFEDDKAHLRARVQRLKGALAHAEDPPSRTRRLVSNVAIADGAPDLPKVRCNFIVFQSRLETTETFYVGRREDWLRPAGAAWKIARREIVLDHAVIPRTISILL
jgi:dibenzofuran dioxygenase beta subunit